MNFSELIETVKNKIESLDKKSLVIFSSLLLIILVSLILLIILLSNNKNKVQKEIFPLVLKEELIIGMN